jgi:hypothetical protein
MCDTILEYVWKTDNLQFIKTIFASKYKSW